MKLNFLSVTPPQALDVMKACHEENETVMLHGNRGVGKTELGEQFALHLGGPCYKLLLTQIEAPDIRGLIYPDIEAGVTRWLRPDFLPVVGPGVIFADEFTAAETRIQKTAYQLLRERRIGSWEVPKGIFIMAAGNTGDDGAVIHQLDAPAADRMVHLRIVSDVKSWIAWAETSDINPAIIAFLKQYPQSLDGTDQQQQQEHLLGPSPRGWARFGKFLGRGLPRPQLEMLASGIVGQHTAAAFMTAYDDIVATASLSDLLAMPPEVRPGAMPTTIPGIYNLAYALRASVHDQATMFDAIEIAAIFTKIPAKKLPLSEFQTLVMELLMEKVHALGGDLLRLLANHPRIVEYFAKQESVSRR